MRMLILLIIAFVASAPVRASVIPLESITATASSEFISSLTGASLTIDGSGLLDGLHDADPSGHSMWLSALGGGGNQSNNPAAQQGSAWLQYDFNTPVTISEIHLWNHNQPGLTDRGLRRISIHYRGFSSSWFLAGEYELARAPGTANYPPGDRLSFSLEDVSSVLITASSEEGNYGSEYYGLSEIQFIGVVEPCWPSHVPIQIQAIQTDEQMNAMMSARPVGWLGSDIAKSIALTEDRILWLYGDTFVGEIENGARKPGARFINNSIGIQQLDGQAPGSIEFHWGPGDTSFFPHQPGTPGQLYWPTSGFLLDGKLYIFCYSVEGFFTIRNTTMITVSNPLDPPMNWQWQATDFGLGGPNLGFHTGFHLDETHVYMLGYEDTISGRAAVLGRMGIDDLKGGGLSDAMEFWVRSDNDDIWGNQPTNLIPLFFPGVTESDLVYMTEFGVFVTTAYDPFQNGISLVYARELTGPWSKPLCLYDVPEFDNSPFDIIAYAARPHAALARGSGELVFSYATNTFGTVDPLFTPDGLGIYVPRFFKVQFSGTGPSGWRIF